MTNTKYINSEKNRKHEKMSWKPNIGKWKRNKKMKKVTEVAEKLPMAGAGVIVGLGGYAAYELMKLNKFQRQQDALRRAAHMERFEKKRASRGGGGGMGNMNITKPLTTPRNRAIRNKMFDV